MRLLRRFGIPVIFGFSAFIVALNFFVYFTAGTSNGKDDSDEKENPVAAGLCFALADSKEQESLRFHASAIQLAGVDAKSHIWDAPPWTKLESGDMDALMAQAEGTSSAALPGLPVAQSSPEKRMEEDEDFMKKPPESFNYVYSGWLKGPEGERALIEDTDANTSYFRVNGENMGDYRVLNINSKSLELLHKKSGRRIRLLRAMSGSPDRH